MMVRAVLMTVGVTEVTEGFWEVMCGVLTK